MKVYRARFLGGAAHRPLLAPECRVPPLTDESFRGALAGIQLLHKADSQVEFVMRDGRVSAG